MIELNRLFDMIGYDGMKHIILSAILTVVAKFLLPLWVVCPLVFAIGIAKEIYDKVSGKGCAELKDIACDVVGVIIGAL